jgi:hypothetical protein
MTESDVLTREVERYRAWLKKDTPGWPRQRENDCYGTWLK